MKRLFVILSLILALSICFSACGDKTPTESTSESLTESTESESTSGRGQESDSSSFESTTETGAATDDDSSEENSSSTDTDYDVETDDNTTESETAEITTDGGESSSETEKESVTESDSNVTEGTEETEDPRLSAEYAPVLYFSAKDIYRIASEYVDGWKLGSEYLDGCQLSDDGKSVKLITSSATHEAFFNLLTEPAEAAPYMAIKYRTTTTNILLEVFVDSENLSVTGGCNATLSVNSTGKWETAIVDLTSKISAYDGEVANYIRFDFLNSPAGKLTAGDYMEIEYIGFFKSEADFGRFEGIKTKFDYSLIDSESGYSLSSLAYGSHIDVAKATNSNGDIIKQVNPGVVANSRDNRFLLSLKTQSTFIDMNGWAVVDGGIASYKWSADGGKTWNNVLLVGADSYRTLEQAHLEAVSLYLTNDKTQFESIFADKEASYVGGGFQHATMRIDLSKYVGQTVDVVLAAVPAADQSTLCPLAIFADITVIE